jgi:hypothetical protein
MRLSGEQVDKTGEGLILGNRVWWSQSSTVPALLENTIARLIQIRAGSHTPPKGGAALDTASLKAKKSPRAETGTGAALKASFYLSRLETSSRSSISSSAEALMRGAKKSSSSRPWTIS